MKKYWKINYNADLKKSLEYLNISKNYIKVLLEKNSDMMICLKKNNYIFITYHEKFDHTLTLRRNFGWVDDEKWLKERDYTYLGEVNLRKQKLEKLKKL